MALVVAGDTAKEVAQRMKGWLRRVRDKLGKHNLLLNRDKEFMFSRDRECLNAWMHVNPHYQGTVSQQVRDLGVCVRGYAWKYHMVEARMAPLHIIAVRIGMLPVERTFKGNMAQSIIFGRGLYGVEVEPITQQQVTVLRKLMTTAIWRNVKMRNRRALLLLTSQGRWEPQVVMAKRIMGFWQK
jgi:hypothetical protein